MITESSVRNVSKIGDVVEASYTIEDSAKIFSILRSNIYSDKILAVIREYSTNGWDGHVLAGTPDRKLLVTLPTSLSPVFKVRDFGVGLSEESVMHIYTSYGTSTKDKSNDFNGTFGLGSKSAFAYGNTFGITSYFNGVKTLYTAYLDETNIGKIRREYSEPTTEENGVEIEIVVKNSDIRAFNDTASNFYKHFMPCPDFVGGDGYVVDSINHFHEKPKSFIGNGWYIFDSKGEPYWRRENTIARMGNVSYPISLDALSWSDNRSSLLNKNQLVIDVPIGAVSITASREALEYDKRTKDYLINRICEIHAEIVKQTQDKIDACPTFWEAAILLNSLNDLDSSIGNKITFNKWNHINYTKPTNSYYGSSSVFLDDVFIRDEIVNKFGVSMKSFTYFSSPRLSGYRLSNLVPDRKTFFVLNRPGKVKKEEVNWRIRGAYNSFKQNTKSDNISIILVDFNGKDTSDELKSGILAGASIHYLEHFDIVKYTGNRSSSPRRATVNTDLSKTKIFKYNGGNDRVAKSNNWECASNDLIAKGNGVYVTINAYDVVNNNHFGSMGEVSGLIELIDQLGIPKPSVYGIRDSVNKIGAGWVKLEDWIVNAINSYIKTHNLGNKIAEHILVQDNLRIGNRQFKPEVGGHLLGSYLLDKNFPDCDLKQFAIRVSQNNNNYHYPCNSIYRIMCKYKIEGINIGQTDILDTLESLKKKYPGLAIILNAWGEDEDKEELIRYVQMMNKTDESNCFRVVI